MLLSPKPVVHFTKLSATAKMPTYATEGSAGLDLYADEDTWIGPGRWALVPMNIAIWLPPGFEAQIRPRSGLALKHGITVLNSPGTIDSDYRGGIHAMLFNSGTGPFRVQIGDRVAQMVIARYERAHLNEVESLDETARGAGGFGSTGR